MKKSLFQATALVALPFLVVVVAEIDDVFARNVGRTAGGVNISRCMQASTSRAILTRNSSQTRRGRACSSASSKRSSVVSPSIQRRIESIRPIFWSAPVRRRDLESGDKSPHSISIKLQVLLVHPAVVQRIRIVLRPAVLSDLNLAPVGVNIQHPHARAGLSQPHRIVVRARVAAQVRSVMVKASRPTMDVGAVVCMPCPLRRERT